MKNGARFSNLTENHKTRMYIQFVGLVATSNSAKIFKNPETLYLLNQYFVLRIYKPMLEGKLAEAAQAINHLFEMLDKAGPSFYLHDGKVYSIYHQKSETRPADLETYLQLNAFKLSAECNRSCLAEADKFRDGMLDLFKAKSFSEFPTDPSYWGKYLKEIDR
jgi:hypothetical protein